MLAIKLSRIGRKNRPYFRIIVLDKRKDPWGDFIENLGRVNPRTKELELDVERTKHWLSKGAQPSKTLHNLFIAQGIIEGKKVGVSRISKKRKEKLAEKEKEAKEKEAPKEEAKSTEDKKEETPKEEAKSTEDKKEETPKEEAKPTEDKKEEKK